MERLFVTKAKWNGEQIEIKYTNEREANTDEFVLTSTDAPAPSFEDALRALKPLVASIYGYPDGSEKEVSIKVNGATFTENEKQGFGGVILAVGMPPRVKGVLVMNTAHMCEGQEGQDDEPGILTADELKAMRKLHREALAYIKGKRAQPGLPMGDGAAAGSTRASMNDEERREQREADEAAERLGETPAAAGEDEGKPGRKRPKAIAEAAPKEKAKKPGKPRILKRAKDEVSDDE